MSIIIISCSLHPQSRSYILATQLAADFENRGIATPIYDLREIDLDMYDTLAHQAEPARALRAVIHSASAVILALPIYNYDVNAAAKNLIELTGRAWTRKLVGFLCAAGGKGSYMSVMGIANSLMLDFRCVVIPRFVYAVGGDFGDDREPTMYIESEAIKERITELAETTSIFVKGLRDYQKAE